MATKKISELTTTTTPLSSALFPIVQSSDNFSVTFTNIAANMPDLTATSLTSSGTLTVSGNTTIGGTTDGVAISQGAIAIKNGGSQSNVDFYCESANAHLVAM